MTKLYPTYNLKAIYSGCKEAELYRQMTVVMGSNGMGVTTALKQYCVGENVFYFSFSDLANLRESCGLMMRKAGDDHCKRANGLRMHELFELITSSIYEGLFLFDHVPLTTEIISFVRQLRERTRRSAGMVLRFANENAITEMQGGRIIGGDKFKRLVSRTVKLYSPTKDEVRDIASVEGIEDWRSLYLSSRSFTELFNEIRNLKQLVS